MTVLISNPPSPHHVESLKDAALDLTNDKNSIKITTKPTGNYHALITDFKIRKAAQSKVIDGIYETFKSCAWSFEGYQDMSIQFP
ncbi:MAG: hypothetical protein QNJ46_07270 [Leptolyngbyaceae cyanobacterium MO_188.B28]|nr:hypothetical protein [Leptolyngbyaceae cyanobacterium MO_188.B28]